MNEITAIIIARNEERNIAKAITSLQGFPEILVMDSGSIDRTVEMAISMGATVHQTDWPGYAEQRKRAILKAGNEWILFLDADESLDSNLNQELLTMQLDGTIKGFYLKRGNYFLGRKIRRSRWGNDWQLRLFMKSSATIPEVDVHEGVIVNGSTGKIYHGSIRHDTIQSLSRYLEKLDEYTSLESRQKTKSGRRFSGLRLFWQPLSEFWKLYIVLQGWQEGMRGLCIAAFSALGRFLVMAKIREIDNG